VVTTVVRGESRRRRAPNGRGGVAVTVVGTHHTGFHVADLERSLAFYCELLGFEVVWRRVNCESYVRHVVGYPAVELHQAMVRVPGSDHYLELMDYRSVEREAVDTAPSNPGTAHICLLVRGLRELYAVLVSRGVGAVSEPVPVTSGVNTGRLVVYMIDPDGFRVELLSAEPEA
jgi:catechol 2,3-dioxygenase-like lactoylglutathione lyase family enzyme